MTLLPAPVTEIDPAVDREQALLGSFLVNNEAYHLARDLVDAGCFLAPQHAQIFQAIAGIIESGRVADPRNVRTALPDDFKAAGLSVGRYLMEIIAKAMVVTLFQVHDYASDVRDASDRRKICAIAESTTKAATKPDYDENASTIAADAITKLDAIITARSDRHAAQMSIGAAAVDAVDAMCAAMRGEDKSAVKLGLHDLDTLTGGLRPGELAILAGRPGMGKSALATNFAVNVAKDDRPVLSFNLEMTAEDMARRALAAACYDTPEEKIAYAKIKAGDVSDSEADRIAEAARDFGPLPVMIEQQAGLSVAEIAARSKKHAQSLARQGKKLGLVIVDHMHIVQATNRYGGNRVAEITEISNALKGLAKTLGVPVLALAQLNRAVEGRADKRPNLVDLRDSGSIEQDADLILFAYREAYYLKNPVSDKVKEAERIEKLDAVRNQIELLVAKNRSGAEGIATFFIDIAANFVRDGVQRDNLLRWRP